MLRKCEKKKKKAFSNVPKLTEELRSTKLEREWQLFEWQQSYTEFRSCTDNKKKRNILQDSLIL